MRRSFGELEVTRTKPPQPRSRFDEPCYGGPTPARNTLRHLLGPTHRAPDPGDRADRAPPRPIPQGGPDAPRLPPVRDPVARAAARTGADHRRMDLQSPRAARPPRPAPPDPLPGGVVSPSLQDTQPHRGHPVRHDHPLADAVPAPSRGRAVGL